MADDYGYPNANPYTTGNSAGNLSGSQGATDNLAGVSYVSDAAPSSPYQPQQSQQVALGTQSDYTQAQPQQSQQTQWGSAPYTQTQPAGQQWGSAYSQTPQTPQYATGGYTTPVAPSAPAPVASAFTTSSAILSDGSNLPLNLQPLSPLSYVGYSILFAIPIVGLIFEIMWAIDDTGNINRRNFARAMLINIGIVAVFFILLLIVTGGALLSGYN